MNKFVECILVGIGLMFGLVIAICDGISRLLNKVINKLFAWAKI